MAEINQLQDEIIEEFSDMDDWMDRYAYIIELGNGLDALDESLKTPDARAACGSTRNTATGW